MRKYVSRETLSLKALESAAFFDLTSHKKPISGYGEVMNLSAVYSKTGKGAKALASKSKALSNNALRILSYIDGKNTAQDILAGMGKLSTDKFNATILGLLNEGYIKEIGEDYLSRSLSEFEILKPIEVEEISAEEFLQLEIAIDDSGHTVGEHERAEAEARAKAYEAEQKRLREEAIRQEEAERKLLKAADILAQSGDRLDIEALAKTHTKLNPRTRQARRIKTPKAQGAPSTSAPQEPVIAEAHHADKARLQAEALLKAQKDAAVQAELDAQLKRKEAEALAHAKAMQEQELRAKQEEENQKRAEAERLAVQARLKAEQEAKEAAEIKARLEAEKLAKRQEEDRARAEAKRLAAEAKLKAEQEAKDAAAAKAKREAEDRARREAEKQARIAEEQRAKAEQKAADEAERVAKLQLKAEQAARMAAEKLARSEAKAIAKREAERLASIPAEKRAAERAEASRQRLAVKAAKAEAKQQQKLQRQAAAMARAQEKANKRSTSQTRDYAHGLPSLPWTRIKNVFLGVFVIGLLMLMLLPFVNLGIYVDAAQRVASTSIGERVLIGGMHVSYWPKPHLELDNVSIGSAGINATAIKLQPVLSTLTAPTKIFNSIEVDGLTLNESTMHKPAAWLTTSQKQRLVKTSRIKAKNVTLNLPNITLPAFNGDILLSKEYQLQKAVISSDTGNVHIEITPGSGGYNILASASNFTSPLSAPIHFDELQIEGVIQDHQLQLHKVSGQLYGGKLDARMTTAWDKNWLTEGNFKLENVVLADATPVFTQQISMEGALTADGIWSASAQQLSQLLSAPNISARFNSTNGAIKGIDIVRAIQARGQEKAISGTTRFEQFAGRLELKNSHYKYQDLELRANELQAQGEADIFRNQELAGAINVRLAVDSRELHTRLHLTGKLAQPMRK